MNIASLVEIDQVNAGSFPQELRTPYYMILIFDGDSSFAIDFTPYECTGKNMLFLSPYQFLNWRNSASVTIGIIRFHGDFYCIEYHKKEVACNGILFNNIYQQPYVPVNNQMYAEVCAIIKRMQQLAASGNEYDVSVLRSYLQLILALSSKEKQQSNVLAIKDPELNSIVNFQTILENHFLEYRDVAFFAERFGLSVNTFSKKIKKHFGKPPSKLIQERIVLEAKKLLHLTRKPIKQISAELHFEDEFYFSRYFKKEAGVAPKQFRENTGISIVAK